MSAVKTPLTHVPAGNVYISLHDDAWVVTNLNSHADILRHVVDELGFEEARILLDMIEADIA